MSIDDSVFVLLLSFELRLVRQRLNCHLLAHMMSSFTDASEARDFTLDASSGRLAD